MSHLVRRQILGFLLLIALSSCTSEEEQELSLQVNETLYILDEVSNSIHTYDLEQQIFTSFTQYADLEKFRSNDFDLSSNGEIYVSTYNISGGTSTPSNQLRVFDASTLEEGDSLHLDLYPSRFDLSEDNTLYMSHGYEFPESKGWAVSIYKKDTSSVQEILAVAGAPSPPKVLTDGKAYFPYFGAGDNHYGDSNVMVYNPSTETTSLLFFDNFTYLPPRDLFWDGTSYFAVFNGTLHDAPPYFTKPENNSFMEAEKALIIFKETDNDFELIPLNIQGSDMEIIVKENIAYIYYCDSVGAETSGLALVNLTTKELIENYELGGGTFSEEMLLISTKLYITNRSRQGLDIFDTLTQKFTFVKLPEGGTPYDLAAF